jgi:hypothetical protein
MKTVKSIILILVAGFVIIQFLPSKIPGNKPEDDKSITYDSTMTEQVLSQLRTSCFDCHSNQTNLPWYSKFAPVSWLLADHITDARLHLNFSEWSTYSQRQKIGRLTDIKDEVESDGMPLKSYLLMHHKAKLDEDKKSLLLQWAERTSDKIME